MSIKNCVRIPSWQAKFQRPRLATSLAMGLALATCLLASFAHSQSSSDWLYAVERPVAVQSVQARNEAAADGLLEILSRMTGLISVPRTPAVVKALAKPEALYNQFVFFSRTQDGGNAQNYVRISFEATAIQTLVESARLPVWWSQRPSVMVWLVLDSGGEREILDATSTHPMVLALKARARQRGIAITLPLMDLDDTLAVSAADVWGKLGQTVDVAAQRYGADLVLVGRASDDHYGEEAATTFRGDWEVWLDEQPLAKNFTALEAQKAAHIGIDLLVDQLVEQYAVLPRAPRIQRLAIGGVKNPAGYAELMRYLSSLEFVNEVDVAAISASSLQLNVTSRAEVKQLLMLLTANGRLIEDSFSRGADIRLLWQG